LCQEAEEEQAPARHCRPLPASAQLPAHAGRDASSWLDAHIEFSRTWSPLDYEGFHKAVGLWVLSTVAARGVS
jgi:hypothetical protein